MAMLDAIPGVLVGGEQESPEVLKICEATGRRFDARAADHRGASTAAAPDGRARRSKQGSKRALSLKRAPSPSWRQSYHGLQSTIINASGTVLGGAAKGIRAGELRYDSSFAYTPADHSVVQARAALATKEVGSDAWWCTAQRLVRDAMGLQQPPDFAKLLGRKATRLNSDGVLKFMVQLFPCAKFVLTYRNDVQKQLHSAYWASAVRKKKTKDGSGRPDPNRVLRNETRALLKFHANHPNATFVLPLETISVPRYNAMLHWLGARECKFQRVVVSNSNVAAHADKAHKSRLKGKKEMPLHNNAALREEVDEESLPILTGDCQWPHLP
jgi:hypothetical protein